MHNLHIAQTDMPLFVSATWHTKRKRPSHLTHIGFKSLIFPPVSAFKFYGWHPKIIGHLFYTTPSLVRHFKPVGDLKLELQSRSDLLESKSAIFCPVRPWNVTNDLEKLYITYSILCQALCIISKPSVTLNWSYSLEILNFGSTLWFCCPVWTWNLTDDIEETIGHLFYTTLSAVHHFKAMG